MTSSNYTFTTCVYPKEMALQLLPLGLPAGLIIETICLDGRTSSLSSMGHGEVLSFSLLWVPCSPCGEAGDFRRVQEAYQGVSAQSPLSSF